MSIAATVATGAKVLDTIETSKEDINQNVADIEDAVHNEGARTRSTARQEGETTRDAVDGRRNNNT